MQQEAISIERLTTIQQFHQWRGVAKAGVGTERKPVVPRHVLLIAQKSGGLVKVFGDRRRMAVLLCAHQFNLPHKAKSWRDTRP